MADKTNRVPGGAPGKYYVDSNCIACGICAGDVPECFMLTADGSAAVVIKQPENPQEKAKCESVAGSCPAEAIGNDG